MKQGLVQYRGRLLRYGDPAGGLQAEEHQDRMVVAG